MSRIPTFILDLDHPWTKDNQAHIDNLEDPVDALCSLNSTLRTKADKYRYPPDLYKHLQIDNNKAGVSRGGWANAEARLKEILACPAALHDVEQFTVSIYISDGKYGIGVAEPSTPPKQIPELFIRAFDSMPNLRTLDWNTFNNGDAEFKQAFADAKLNLPSVRQLFLAKNSEFLVDACLETIDLRSGGASTSDYFRSSYDSDPRQLLVESAGRLSHLTTFRMQAEWELENLKALLEASPALKTIMIDGEIASRYGSRRDKAKGSRLMSYLDTLQGFEKLETLHLPTASRLGLGFDGGPWCGNAYMGPNGQKLREKVEKQHQETTEKAGSMTLDKLPNLQVLEIGRDRADIVRDDKGVRATWEWTTEDLRNWTIIDKGETYTPSEQDDDDEQKWGEEDEDEDASIESV